MSTDTSFNTNVKVFFTPSLPKHPGNPKYSAIKEAYQLLTENVVLIKSALGGDQNRYLGIVLLPDQYY